jgi:hypothetical protein
MFSFGGMMNPTGKNGGHTFGSMPEDKRREAASKGGKGMSVERRREIASMGGKAAHASGNAHQWTSETARVAGKKGGDAVSQDRAAVSANRAHMAEIGRKGGEAVSSDRQHMAEIGRQGGLATTAAASPIVAQHC